MKSFPSWMDKKSQFVVVAFPAEPNTVQNLDIRMSIWHCAFTAHRTSFNNYWILTQPRVFRFLAVVVADTTHLCQDGRQILKLGQSPMQVTAVTAESFVLPVLDVFLTPQHAN